MAKLGYTWYPKDWGNSESVFEMNLSERGLYRELIDLAMLNDNKTEIKLDVWSRKFAISIDDLKSILGRLSILNVIEIKGELLFIPSCESRLQLVRGGKNGRPTETSLKNLSKGTSKPISEATPKQTKRETKIEKESKDKYKSFLHLSISFEDVEKLKSKYTITQIDGVLESIENYSQNKKYSSLYLTAKKWLEKEYPNTANNLHPNGIGKTNQKLMTYDD